MTAAPKKGDHLPAVDRDGREIVSEWRVANPRWPSGTTPYMELCPGCPKCPAAVLEAPRSDLADVPVRWSWLSHFASSPLHARHAALYGKEPTAAMKLGTAGHVVTFDEPHDVFRTVNPKTGKVWNRNSKAWDEFEADCEDRAVTPLTIAEYDKARRIRDALRSHRDAAPLLFGEGVVREQPIHWVRHGRACSSRPDARKPGEWIADLKTCRTARPDRFMKAAQWAGYTGQLVFYSEADAFEANRNPASLASQMLPLYIVAVEPFPPYAVTVFELDETAKEHGRRAVATAWGQLEACEAVNAWPGYAEGVVPFVIEANGDDQANLDDLDPPDPEDAQEEY